MRRSFVNLRLADWSKFKEDVESSIPESAPISASKGEKIFCDVILRAAKRNIPTGYRQNFIPNLPPEARPIRDRRDRLRAADPAHPELAAVERELRDVCDKATYAAFEEELENTDYKTNSPKFANLVRRLCGKQIF